MLEKVDSGIAKKMTEGVRKEVKTLMVRDLTRGQLILVFTVSGNWYLFEMTNPQMQLAHVFRHDLADRLRSGYLGEHRVSLVFEVGVPICHADSITSSVTKIFLLK